MSDPEIINLIRSLRSLIILLRGIMSFNFTNHIYKIDLQKQIACKMTNFGCVLSVNLLQREEVIFYFIFFMWKIKKIELIVFFDNFVPLNGEGRHNTILVALMS